MPAPAPPVAELRALAAEPRLAARADRLRALADDLETDTDLGRWARVDLVGHFVRPESVANPVRSRRRERGGMALDLAPAVLIFLPIFFTWTGLFAATRAYRLSRGEPSLEGMSFLEQWQTGFAGGLSPLLSFDRIALLTLAGVLLLVGVTVAQSVVQRRVEHGAAREKAELLRRLAVALTDADIHLAVHRMDTAARLDTVADALREAARRLAEAGRGSRRLHQGAVEAAAGISKALDRAEGLTDALTAVSDANVRALTDAAGDLSRALAGASDAAVRALADASDTAARALAEASGELARTVTGASDAAVRTVAKASDGIGGAAERVAVAADALGRSGRDVGDGIGRSLAETGTHIRAALDDWRQEGTIYAHRHEVGTEHLVALVSALEVALERARHAMDAMPRSLDRLEHQYARFDTTMTATADRIETRLDAFAKSLPDGGSGAVDPLLRELERVRLAVEAGGRRRRWFG
ncbi:hypothetical protein LO762_00175 [Actinocorallia sp. API 0066]|uniref:hypothetical protein n=1 Tax=Actinocorallia sp. API 0066 TaxID=2896846 RepID=UPI001E39F107|nr:hypothetical protein [Actinocorallia sp. API 0066]MCD0447618.1 hypothetical protein [Actinocorallia sp. API 0066]